MHRTKWTLASHRPPILLSLLITLFTVASAVEPVNADKGSRKARKEAKKQQRASGIERSSYNPGPGWEPYLEDEDGFRKKIITPIEQNDDKDWMGLRFTEYPGPKHRLSVERVDNRSGYSQEVPLMGIESLIISGLQQSGRFDVVERERLAANLAEQDLGARGRIAKPSAAKIGQVLGAEYQVFATVVEWTPTKKSRGGGMFGLRVGKKQAEVAISVRVVDASTSRTIFSETERATAGSWSFGLHRNYLGRRHQHRVGGSLGFDASSPVGYAVQAAINKAVYRLAIELKDQRWRGAVMRVDGRTVHLNAGENLGIEVGYRLTCISKGEKLTDPTTGLDMGFTQSAIGTLAITGVEEAYSVAQVVKGCEGLKFGDYLELESTGQAQASLASTP